MMPAGRRCALYCALCTKRLGLLRGLMQVFAAAAPAGKAAILQHASGGLRLHMAESPSPCVVHATTPMHPFHVQTLRLTLSVSARHHCWRTGLPFIHPACGSRSMGLTG